MNIKLALAGLVAGVVLAAQVRASEPVDPEQWLLGQIQLGEARHNDELVQASIYRLLKVAPEHPRALAAKVRLALRQHQPEVARDTLRELSRVAPGSHILAMARLYYSLSSPPSSRQLQQARVLSRRDPEKSLPLYDRLYADGIPAPELALEYWNVVARTPGGQRRALNGLEQLVRDYPGGADYRLALAKHRLDTDPADQKAYRELRVLTADKEIGAAAAAIWADHLLSLPVSDRALAQMRQYLQVLPERGQHDAVRRKMLQQQRLLADPAYRARMDGLALLDRPVTEAHTRAAEEKLTQALARRPNDAEALGGLGIVRMRQGLHSQALDFFLQAQQRSRDPDQGARWRGLIATARYWIAVKAGDAALQQGDLAVATTHFREAARRNDTDPYAVIGLGEVSYAQGDVRRAERYFRDALARDANNESALRQLLRLYVAEGRSAQARSLLQPLTGELARSLEVERRRLESGRLQRHASALMASGAPLRAAHFLELAVALQPDDPWLLYDLAKARQARGDDADAVAATFRPLLASQPDSASVRYAYALLLDSLGQTSAALGALQGLAESDWTDDMHRLAERLNVQLVLARARALWDAGQLVTAQNTLVEQLARWPERIDIALLLGDWASQDGHWQQALEYYRQVLARQPDNLDASLGRLEALQAMAQADRIRMELESASWVMAADDSGQRRRLAALWRSVGEVASAQGVLAPSLTLGVNDPLLFRDAARLAVDDGDPAAGLAYYRTAMALAGLGEGADNLQFTRQTLPQADDDWMVRSLRTDAASLYQRQNGSVTLAYDYADTHGTPGVSQLTTETAMLEIDWPYRNGSALVRLDQVALDAGVIDLDDPDDASKLGSGLLCAPGCGYGDRHQHASGTSLAVGWQGEHWLMDLGTTPLGFAVSDWVGGIEYRGNWKDIGWSATLSRRPLSSSLLAFSGTTDPNTGLVWGGVRATGLSLGASLDRGADYGVWSSLRYHLLQGRNIADNDRLWLMGGVYRRLIDEPGRRFRIGASAMAWRFGQDLSEYTLGQGGYYSPQSYLSVSLPLGYRERIHDWSWALEGSLSLSASHSDGGDFYPGYSSLQSQAEQMQPQSGIAPATDAGGSPGLGWRGRAWLEYRLTPHWYIGAMLSLQRGDEYTTGNGQLYLRYRFRPWGGQLDMPPEPLTPYAQFQ